MNQSLVDRWKAAQQPFDGSVLSLYEPIPIADLLLPVALITDELHRIYGHENLNKIQDWHEHDGYINSSSPSTWEELRSFVNSPEDLAKAYIDETHVSLGFFPESYSFYFRIHILEPDYPILVVTEGNFDLSCKSEILVSLQNELTKKDFCLSCEPAKAYFDRRDRN